MFLGTYPMIFVDFYLPKYLFKHVIEMGCHWVFAGSDRRWAKPNLHCWSCHQYLQKNNYWWLQTCPQGNEGRRHNPYSNSQSYSNHNLKKFYWLSSFPVQVHNTQHYMSEYCDIVLQSSRCGWNTLAPSPLKPVTFCLQRANTDVCFIIMLYSWHCSY